MRPSTTAASRTDTATPLAAPDPAPAGEANAHDPPRPHPRLVGLDVLRGAALAVMLLTPVTGTDGSYPLLGHAPWDGFKVADAILPTFLLAGGASLALLLRPPTTAAIRVRLVRRALALVVLGVVYDAVGQPLSLGDVRLTGVLQLIGLSGALAAGVMLLTRRVIRSPAVPALVAVGLAAAQGVAVARTGGCPPGVDRCSPWIDLEGRLLGPAHLYADGRAGFDPEGIGPLLGATALVLLGLAAMDAIHRWGPGGRTLAVIALAGMALVAAGLLLDGVQPINKRLHTPAFTALAGGIGVVLLAILTATFDARLPDRVARAGRVVRAVLADPFTTLGRNALVVFLLERVLLVAVVQTEVVTAFGRRTLQDALIGALPVEGVRVHLALTAVLLAVVLAVTYAMRALRWRIVL